MKRRTKIIFFILIIILISILGTAYYYAEKTILPPAGNFVEKEFVIKIKSGSSLRTIADMLYEEGVITSIEDFIFTAKLFHYTNKLKAGKYKFRNDLSNYKVLKTLTEGKVSQEKIVIPEGFTSKQIAALLQKTIEIDSSEFMELVNDKNFIRNLGIAENSLEGYLYPDTYYFYWGIQAENIIKKLMTEFNRKVNDSLRQKISAKDWTLNEIVTLASIIEGEAMVESERPLISAVYHNRLRQGMLLQADPTIQYIIPDGPRRLLNRDLAINSPYNTYKFPGLPPGPVNNPGIHSIIAAIEPATVPYLYFVARGDGSHTFSTTLREHLMAKQKFDQYRREVRRKENAIKRPG